MARAQRWWGGRLVLATGWALVGGASVLVACAEAAPRPPVARPAAVAVVPAVSATTRDRERVVALLNEGDALVKVDVNRAIAKYEQALDVDPRNLAGLWQVSLAYEKKEDWASVAAAMARAVRLAPKVEYLHLQGRALVELAQDGDAASYELSREPLEQCLKVDAKLADCAYLLGQVELAAEQLQQAAERFTLAVRLDPQQPLYYVTLASVYGVFKQPMDAERVLTEGLQQVSVNERNRAELAAMAIAAARFASGRNDTVSAQAWLDRAETLADDVSPELLYQLAAQYASAVTGTTRPPDTAKAQRLLDLFVERVCRGAAAKTYDDECWASASLIQRLSFLQSVPPTVAKKPTLPTPPTPLPPGMPIPKLETHALRAGDAYTVWGAGYLFRMGKLKGDASKPVAITGYIVKTNLGDAPRCAVHRAGIADAQDCRAEIPAFWLGDRPSAPEADCIKVMGFASNYAQLFEAIKQADSPQPELPYQDAYWGQTIPNPLPAAGAKVTVRGSYGPTFTKASFGGEVNVTMGILDFIDRDVLEPAPELATLPGVKRRKR